MTLASAFNYQINAKAFPGRGFSPETKRGLLIIKSKVNSFLLLTNCLVTFTLQCSIYMVIISSRHQKIDVQQSTD